MFTEKSRHIDSASVSPSVHSSEERPRSRATSQLSRPQSQPSRSGIYAQLSDIHTHSNKNNYFLKGHPCGSLNHLESSGATPLLGSHEALEDEIRRLRERLQTVEAENSTLNTKLSQQQWDLEHRLAEIEMQICGASSESSLNEENEAEELERNRESII